MGSSGYSGRFSRIETHVPKRRSVVTTPQFWIYIFAGLILAFIVAGQLGLAPKTSADGADHPDLNATDRPQPAVPAEGRRTRTKQPATEPLPVEPSPAAMGQPAMAQMDTVPHSKLVRTFEPPPTVREPAPKPAMPETHPSVVQGSTPAVEHVQAPVDHVKDVKPANPPPADGQPQSSPPQSSQSSSSPPESSSPQSSPPQSANPQSSPPQSSPAPSSPPQSSAPPSSPPQNSPPSSSPPAA